MNGRSQIQPQFTTHAGALHRLWNVEALEQRLLLSGIGDALNVRKIKYTEFDGDKVKISLAGKDKFDISFDRDGGGNILGVSAITLHGIDPNAHLNFSVKPPKLGGSNGFTLVGSILSDNTAIAGNPVFSLNSINANNAQIDSLSLTGSLTGSLTTNRDLGSVAVGNVLNSVTVQGGHDITGNVSAGQIGRIIDAGGDISGSIVTSAPLAAINSIQAASISGSVDAAGGLKTLTLTGDLSGVVAFHSGTLAVLIGGNLTSTGSINGADPGAGIANVDAGSFTRVGIVGNVAGSVFAEGTLGLGVGGSLTGTASAGGNLTVKANLISADLSSASGDVAFAMNTGGFAGAINAAHNVTGNGLSGGILMRGGNFSGSIIAGGDVSAMTFVPASGGFSGTISAGGNVGDITTNFFTGTASVTGASIGNLTANRGATGDAIASGATFHATGLIGGSIGNITARTVGTAPLAANSVAIGGSFTSDHGNIGNILATNTGNATDPAISGAAFSAPAGSIGTVAASARGGHGISDSNFTAGIAIGDITASSVSGNGFHASGDGQNLFTVTDGSFGKITGASTLGDGIHGGTFTASQNLGDITGSSGNGSGIGDATGGVTTSFTAVTGHVNSLVGTATSGSQGSAGDGIVNIVVHANKDSDGLGIDSISGSSRFGSGIVSSRFTAEGNIRDISGSTNNSDPSAADDGILNSVFRTSSNIGGIFATTQVSGGAGIGSAIEGSLFSALGDVAGGVIASGSSSSLIPSFSANGQGLASVGNTFQNGDVFVAIGNGQVEWRQADGTLVQTLTSGVANNLFTTGMGFDSVGRLYVTMFDSNAASVFSTDGTFTGTFGSGYGDDPESMVFDSAGNVYVGQADGSQSILKFDSAGHLLATYSPATEDRGTDWIDLAADQHTMFYTSEGTEIKRFDVASSDQLSDFNSTPLPGTAAYALRVLSNGGVLVADSESIVRLDAAGNSVQTYDAPNIDNWFALNLDPDGTSFWSADVFSGDVYKFDIATGQVLEHFNTGAAATGGLTIKGEITAASAGTSVIATNGDVKDTKFLAGYDIGTDFTLDGTGSDAAEKAATDPVSVGSIQVTGDWINSFAASGITTTNGAFGDGDDALSAPGSQIKSVSVTSNIAGVTGVAATNYFESDAIGSVSADAIGIDPDSGSAISAVEVNTSFSNGTLGTIGDIAADTTTQRQAIGDGSVFHAGTSIASIIAVNDNTSFNDLNAIGAARFDAGTYIGDITAGANLSLFGTGIASTRFIAHVNNPATDLAIGNVTVTGDGIANSHFDASSPTVAGTALNVGTLNSIGSVTDSTFIATGDIARGVRLDGANHVTTTDLNGDGNLDLIVTNQAADTVSVALGNGDGTFKAPVSYAVGDAPVMTVFANVGGDASSDLIVLNSVSDSTKSDTVSVLIGKGDGTFAPAITIDIGTMSTPTSIAVGDFIEDGKPDLAISDGPTGHVTILKGLGNGAFTEATVSDLVTGSSPAAIELTSATGSPTPPPISFNSDGHIDMAVANLDSDNISVFLGDVGESGAGTGTWSAPSTFSVGDAPVALAIGSFNSILDTKLDIVTANEFSNNISILLGTGTGSFGAATNITVGTNPLAVALADVNGDGYQDVLVVNSGSNSVSVLLGNGLGGFSAPTQFAVGAHPVSIVTGDFNKDGHIDFAVANNGSDSLTVWFGDGSGSFRTHNIFTDSSIFGVLVLGPIERSTFQSDSDLNESGALAGIGGIHVGGMQGTSSSVAFIDSSNFEAGAFGSDSGSNDDTSGLAIGDIKVEAAPQSIAVLNTLFSTGSASALNLGSITTAAGSIDLDSHFLATGNIGDITVADNIAGSSLFTADTDGDGAGDIGSISATQILGADFSGHNVAVSDANTTRAITVTDTIDGLTVEASGSIGNLIMASGMDATNIQFTAAHDIGNITVASLAGLSESQFIAGVAATGKIGDINVTNTHPLGGDALVTSDFESGSGGIGDITATVSASGGTAIAQSHFRAAGTIDATHHATIGNITALIPTAGNSIDGSTFSALGSIGTGRGNADGFNIETNGNVSGSGFYAGYDIGSDGLLGTSDDATGAAVTFINKVSIGGLLIASDITAGAAPGADGHFGGSDDVKLVLGSSIGIVQTIGFAATSTSPAEGLFTHQDPLVQPFTHGIEADLIGELDVKVGGTVTVATLPGYLDTGVNVRVL